MSEPFRSGFVSIVGRPNVGKSTLVNQLVGQKVSIVSDRPQTTRNEIRGVRTTPTTQVVFLDTPGIHRPRTKLGDRTNRRALDTLSGVDLVCLVIEADAPIGRGDRFIAELVQQVATAKILVVNKVDVSSREHVLEHLAMASSALGEFDAYVPLSARTGDNIDALVAEIEARLVEGPQFYPDGVVTDQPETMIVAELLREKLIATARDELPHSIAVTVEELDHAETGGREDVIRFRAVVRVERDSQKGIVIGKGGAVLRDAGTAARLELEALLGAPIHLETVVRVDPDWQRRPTSLDRLGF